MEEILQSGTSNGFGWQGLIQLSMCPQTKRDLPNIGTGSSCFCPLCWRRLLSDTCCKSYRTKCRFQSSYHSNQKFIRKIPYCKVECANSSFVRSFVSPRGTVQCSLCAHYNSVSKQQEGCDLHVKSVKLWQFTFLSLISLHLWLYLKCRNSILFKAEVTQLLKVSDALVHYGSLLLVYINILDQICAMYIWCSYFYTVMICSSTPLEIKAPNG